MHPLELAEDVLGHFHVNVVEVTRQIAVRPSAKSERGGISLRLTARAVSLGFSDIVPKFHFRLHAYIIIVLLSVSHYSPRDVGPVAELHSEGEEELVDEHLIPQPSVRIANRNGGGLGTAQRFAILHAFAT